MPLEAILVAWAAAGVGTHTMPLDATLVEPVALVVGRHTLLAGGSSRSLRLERLAARPWVAADHSSLGRGLRSPRAGAPGACLELDGERPAARAPRALQLTAHEPVCRRRGVIGAGGTVAACHSGVPRGNPLPISPMQGTWEDAPGSHRSLETMGSRLPLLLAVPAQGTPEDPGRCNAKLQQAGLPCTPSALKSLTSSPMIIESSAVGAMPASIPSLLACLRGL